MCFLLWNCCFSEAKLMFCHFKICREKCLCRAGGKGNVRCLCWVKFTQTMFTWQKRERVTAATRIWCWHCILTSTAHSWVKCHITLYTVTLGTACTEGTHRGSQCPQIMLSSLHRKQAPSQPCWHPVAALWCLLWIYIMAKTWMTLLS